MKFLNEIFEPKIPYILSFRAKHLYNGYFWLRRAILKKFRSLKMSECQKKSFCSNSRLKKLNEKSEIEA